jgi:hypothetical protein
MCCSLKVANTALTATNDIPVDLDPVFPFKGEVR